jgi:tape measure domain-containing protein
MSSTDDRIVRMQFDNQGFMKGAADTQKSLSDLDKAVSQAGSGKGLTDLSGQMDQVGIHASAMTVAVTTALATVANKVTNVAIDMAKGLTFDPIKQGFEEYEAGLTKLNTIMNATGLTQEKVQKVLNDLNHYSDQTIYSFSSMTSAIQKFVNAGVPLDQAVSSVKGIANAAAYAGASSEEADRAMYAFSQSMSMGFIMLQDWNQIENANMGTIQFKETLLDTAVQVGELTKRGDMYVTKAGHAISATEGWRDGLQDQWATTEVLNKSLAKYTDLHTKLGREATQSATEVRTFTAFMDTLKESLGSGWASIFKALFGDLNEATKFWTGFSNSIGGVVKDFFTFGATAIQTWRNMGGFEKTIQAILNVLAPFRAILLVIGRAWLEAFPSSDSGAGKALYGVSVGLEAMTRPLKWLADLILGTTPAMVTFFRVIHIGASAIGDAVGYVVNFVRSLLGLAEIKAPSAGGFLDFLKDIGSAIGDAVEKIDELIQKGASIGTAFSGAFGGIKIPDMPTMSMPKIQMPSFSMPNLMPDLKGQTAGLSVISGLAGKLNGDFTILKASSDDVGKSSMFNASFMQSAGETFGGMGDNAKNMATTVVGAGDEIKSAWDGVSSFLGSVIGAIVDKIKTISMDDVVSSFNFAVFTAMGIQIAKFFRTFQEGFEAISGVGTSFVGLMDNAGTALKSFQTQARAELIKQIGIALAILAASLLVIALIPADKLVKALAGLAGVMVIMGVAMKMLTKMIEDLDGKGTTVKMLALSVAMIALGFGMMELAIAMKIMDSVDIDGIVKGLVVMFGAMQAIGMLGKLSAGAAKNMMGGAVAIGIVAGAMLLLAGALLAFKLVDWESMGKAGVALAGLTLAVGALALIPYAGIAKVGLALLGASVGMNAIAIALMLFANVEWESIGKAAVVLLLLTASLAALMYVGTPVSAAMFVGLGAAMLYLSFALKNLEEVSWQSIGKLAVVLLALVVAVAAFAAIMYVLAPVAPMVLLLAAALLALGLAAVAFAGAMAIIVGIAAAGTAAFVAMAVGAAVGIATFLQTLAHEAPVMKKAFLQILQQLIDTIVKAVPMIIDGIKRLWNAVIKELSSNDKGAKMGQAGESWMDKIKGAIQKYLPILVQKAKELALGLINGLRNKAGEIAAAGVALLIALIRGVSSKAAELARAGVGLIVNLIKAIGNEAPKMASAAADLIIKLANGIEDNLVKIVNAGINLIAEFLHDLADAIRNGSAAIGSGLQDVVSAMAEVGGNIIQGMIDGVKNMAGNVLDAVGGVVSGAIQHAKNLLGESSPSKVFKNIGKFLVQGLTHGIQDHAASAIRAIGALIKYQIALSEDSVNRMVQRLDQRAAAARAKAEGLQSAANIATKAAAQTKTKVDDKSARELSNEAKRADKVADAAEGRARAERNKLARQEKWRQADALERAKIKADDAKRQLQAVKTAERDAEAARVEARALDKRAEAKGVTKEQRQSMRKQADKLRKEARQDAAKANKNLKNARDSAREAMMWQRKAGAEAARNMQKQFDAEAKAAKEQAAFDKLSDQEKAARKREEAKDLQAKADKNLKLAKQQAYKDVEKANATAKLAMEQAEKARQLVQEAKDLQANAPAPAQVLDLKPTDAAAIAFNQYADLYDAATAAAAAERSVEFTQNNYSPEALDPATVYRQTNNLFTYAADKLQPSAA